MFTADDRLNKGKTIETMKSGMDIPVMRHVMCFISISLSKDGVNTMEASLSEMNVKCILLG